MGANTVSDRWVPTNDNTAQWYNQKQYRWNAPAKATLRTCAPSARQPALHWEKYSGIRLFRLRKFQCWFHKHRRFRRRRSESECIYGLSRSPLSVFADLVFENNMIIVRSFPLVNMFVKNLFIFCEYFPHSSKSFFFLTAHAEAPKRMYQTGTRTETYTRYAENSIPGVGPIGN